MAPFTLEAGSPLATAIQSAAQAKLIENGWAPEESDTTLSEYVTMMLVNGKDEQGVRSELGGELLGVGEEDEMVAAFVGWLFGEARRLQGGAGGDEAMGLDDGEGAPVTTTMIEAQQSEVVGDESMGEAGAVDGAYVSTHTHKFPNKDELPLTHATNSPSGPKAMRDPAQQSPTRSNNNSQPTRGGRGRGGRMLGQLNRNMDRNSSSQPENDPLRRIKGAASGSGRIDGHANRQNAPRGPRGGALANGVQRAMNGGRGGGRGGAMGGMGGMGNMGGMGGMDMNGMPQEQQAMMMQMMEMQANMMATMMANGGSLPGSPGLHNNQNGGGGGFPPRGGRGGRSMADRISGRGGRGGARNGAVSQNGTDGEGSVGGMDIDRPLEPEKKPLFDTMCKFNLKCLNPDCGFAHQSPANTRAGISLDMSDTCSYGPACQNTKCLSRHPSPALRNNGGAAGGYGAAAGFGGGSKAEVVCRFYPNCSAGAACPFKHPDTRPCRNGADCSVEGCTFAHSSIACRYNPCVRAECPYKHAAGQRRGTYGDKVWTAEDGSAGIMGRSDRFAELAEGEGAAEELILPGKSNGEAMEETPTATEVDVVS
ncbi:oxygen-dependent protoporphyrinogen oxidase [Elasticomyces elasticus]|nr:oxygen-dependent protoporphyrinogen oxidase [Elasticomyces elasticus]KAK3637484.1 oxygen-dependent protoporphyrinogen oxidase [Elasticomyces elasticus]KAK4917856.1 oxygen-dependent protoporphyrinogen oxidase [Elasticomyces elasticus]KAK5757015.1 oxygen-dependent protoporphyrinogen oxidase [Elasticomyces elasticus]